MGLLTEHLDEVQETYLQHLVRAVGFAAAMLAGALACLVHALLPFLFVKTGSNCVRRLHGLMQQRGAPAPQQEPAQSGLSGTG